jgi:hypothetical protein
MYEGMEICPTAGFKYYLNMGTIRLAANIREIDMMLRRTVYRRRNKLGSNMDLDEALTKSISEKEMSLFLSGVEAHMQRKVASLVDEEHKHHQWLDTDAGKQFLSAQSHEAFGEAYREALTTKLNAEAYVFYAEADKTAFDGIVYSQVLAQAETSLSRMDKKAAKDDALAKIKGAITGEIYSQFMAITTGQPGFKMGIMLARMTPRGRSEGLSGLVAHWARESSLSIQLALFA